MRYFSSLILTLLLFGFALSAHAMELVVEASKQKPHALQVQAAIDSLNPFRQYYGVIRLVGSFQLERPIVLPNYILLDLREARLAPLSGHNTLLTNKDWEDGNHHITIMGGIIDGGRLAPPEGEGGHGIYLSRVEDVRIEGVEVRNFFGDGIRLTGRGRHTSRAFLDKISVIGNGRYGLNATWAMRQVQASNVLARQNGAIGVHIDHSEGQYINISADGNKGHGIYIRNVFGASYSNLSATRNGKVGIYVLGMVRSLGSNWAAHNNSRAKKGDSSDIFFSARDDLSYGITDSTRIVGISAGSYPEYGPATEKHAVEFESTDPKRSHPNLRLSSLHVGAGKSALSSVLGALLEE